MNFKVNKEVSVKNQEVITEELKESLEKEKAKHKKNMTIAIAGLGTVLVLAGALTILDKGTENRSNIDISTSDQVSISSSMSNSDYMSSSDYTSSSDYISSSDALLDGYYNADGNIDYNLLPGFDRVYQPKNDYRSLLEVVVVTENEEMESNIEIIDDENITNNLAYVIGKNSDDIYEIILMDARDYVKDPTKVKDYLLVNDNYNTERLTEKNLIPYRQIRGLTRMKSYLTKESYYPNREYCLDYIEVKDVLQMADCYLWDELRVSKANCTFGTIENNYVK